MKKAVSATTTTDIYYQNLPNEELLKTFTVIYDLINGDNVDTFNQMELVKSFLLTVKVSNQTVDKILTNEVFIKDRLYKLTTANSYIKYVSLVDEQLGFDYDLSLNTEILKFNIQYSDK